MIESKRESEGEMVGDRGREREKKRETTYYVQGNPHKIISRFFSRNFVGQKRVAWHIQSAKKIFHPIILCLAKLSFRIEGEGVFQKSKN